MLDIKEDSEYDDSNKSKVLTDANWLKFLGDVEKAKFAPLTKAEPKWLRHEMYIKENIPTYLLVKYLLANKNPNQFGKEMLKTFNLSGSKMGMHLDSNKVVGVDASTGSLGHGLSIGVGTALAARLLKKDFKTFVVLGDGELDEGSNWEAAMSAAHYKLTNLITFVDRNHNMIDGPTEEVMALEPLADKWEAFGFIVKKIDGNNIKELCEAIDFAYENETDKPVLILCDTVKGCGIDFIEGDFRWHYGAFDDEKYENGKKALEKSYAARIERVEKEAE